MPTFLESADRIGSRLCRDAVWFEGKCNWLSLSNEVIDRQLAIALRPLGPDLYAGTSGIALFLAQLWTHTHESMHRRAALGALRQAVARQNDVPPELRTSLYSGWYGIAYSLAASAALLESDELHDSAKRIVDSARVSNGATHGLDIIGGDAGAIIALLLLRRSLPDDSLLAVACEHADRLLRMAHRKDAGWSWDTLPGVAFRHPMGLAHGAAGISAALLELSFASERDDYRHAAEHGFAYEQRWFNAAIGNWPDFRHPRWKNGAKQLATHDEGYSAAWCHGAPGIGLSRLRAHRLTLDDEFRIQAEAALQGTDHAAAQVLASETPDFSLCHGAAGLADYLLTAGRYLKVSKAIERAEEIMQFGINHFAKLAVWPSGVRAPGDVPNLMLGTAGIGQLLLQLHEPSTPSVTFLSPRSSTDEEGACAQFVIADSRATS